MSTPRNWLRDASLNEEAAFRQMFEYFYSDLCVYAKRFILDLNTREDIVQDVFCAIWINRKNIDFSLSMTNFLITSVKNHCLNHMRKNDPYKSDKEVLLEKIPVYAEDNEELFLLNELEELFAETLANLPKEYRIAFVMSKIENRSTSEIAKTLSVSKRTVERYRNRAVEILKTQLKDYLPLLYLFLNIKL